MNRIVVIAVTAIAIVTLGTACGGGNGGEETGPPPSLSGTWEGEWKGSTGIPQCQGDRLTLVITQSGEGQFQVDVDGGCGGRFPATGELSGNAIKLSGSAALGAISYEGRVSDGGRRMSGEWQVTVAPDFEGTWEVRKVSDETVGEASPTPARAPAATPTSPSRGSPTAISTPREGTSGSDEAFPDVPIPEGAVLSDSMTISGPTAPIFVPAPLPGMFGKWEVREYQVSQPPADVTQFYQERMAALWTTVFSSETQTPSYQGVLVVQRTEEGRAVGVIVHVEEGDSPDSAKLTLVRGSQG